MRGAGWLTAALFAALLPPAAIAKDGGTVVVAQTTASPVDATLPDTRAGTDISAPAATETTGTLPIPPLQIGGYIDAAVGYSTNGRGGTGGKGSDDSFLRGTLGGYLQYFHPRLSADLSYSLTGIYWSKFHSQNHITNRLNLTSRLVAIEDTLIVRANAFAAPADLTRAGSLSASGEPTSRFNTRDTYGYFVQPEYIQRFKDFFTSTLSFGHGGVFFVRPGTAATVPPPITPARNSYSTTITEEIKSGTYFERLQWSVIGSYAQFNQTVRSQRSEEGLVNFTYAATRWLKVFGIGGYNDFRSTTTLAKNLSGPTGLGGVTLTNGADLTVTVEAGTQNNFPTYMGSVRWIISPLTHFIAEATDAVSTPQGDILSRLARQGVTNFGNFNSGGLYGLGLNNIDTGTGLGSIGGFSSFGPGGLALDNGIYRIRSLYGTLQHSSDRNTFSLGVFATERDRLDVPVTKVLPRTSVYGLRATAGRQLNQYMTVSANLTYSIGNEFGGHDQIFHASVVGNYRLTEMIDLYLTNHYSHRDSKSLAGFVNAPVSEDQIILGIRAHF